MSSSTFMSVWDFNLLWGKCKVYAAKALAEPRESEMFPFWSSLLLEFLGRATLAKIHPVLLADPREGDNILYVFGYSKAEGPPKSVVSKTVFDRCTKIVPDFTKKELESCLRLIERRNEELHSGTAAFVGLSTKVWLADYFRACKILLSFHGYSLLDLFGKDEAAIADEMILEVDKAIVKEVKRRIADISKTFADLEDTEKADKIKEGSEKAQFTFKSNCKTETCVCCGAEGLLAGKLVSVSEDKIEDGEIVYEKVILPTSYTCFSCGLKLNNHQELVVAEYGGQFTEKETWDPAEFHGIDARADDYDYGND